MFEVRTTDVFERWIEGLADRRTRSVIFNRIDRIAGGHLVIQSLWKTVYSNSECFAVPDNRLHFTRKNREYIVLLCAGDKSTQHADIERAKRLRKEV